MNSRRLAPAVRSSPPRHSTQGRPENFFYFFHKNCPICPFEGLEGLQLSLLRNDFLSFRRRVATRAYRFRPRPPSRRPENFFYFFHKICPICPFGMFGGFRAEPPKIDFLPFPKQGTPLEGEGTYRVRFRPPLAVHFGNDFYGGAIWICPICPVGGFAPFCSSTA